MQVLVRSVCLTVAALLLSAAADPIRARLAAMQPAQLDHREPHDEYVIFDRWSGGKPKTIFAVLFTDSEQATALFAFRVARNGTLRRLAMYEGGIGPRDVTLQDVTGDGVPEALVVESPGNHGVPYAILGWDGRTFRLIGEAGDPRFIDLDHDGIPEMLELGRQKENECGVMVVKPFISKYEDGEFREVTPKKLAEVWELTAGRTIQVVALPDHFSTRCRFHIVNGIRGGKQRATGIELRAWAGVSDDPTVVHHDRGRRLPVSLTRDDEYVDATVTLPSRCMEVAVTLRGPADASAVVMVETTHITSPMKIEP